MKKYFFIAAAAVAALASCSKVTMDEAPEQEISFIAANYSSATKANDGHESFDYTADEFGVSAWYTATNWETDGADVSFMDKVAVGYGVRGLGDTWAPAEAAYFWPKTGAISFIGYYPYSDERDGVEAINATVNTDGTETPTVSFTDYEVVANAAAQLNRVSETSDKNDLMVADFIKDQTANEDGTTHFRNGVAMVFNHLLSKVRISVKQSGTEYNPFYYAIELDGISIENIYNSGTYDGNDWAASTEAVSATSGQIIGKTGDELLALKDLIKHTAEDYYVLPQSLNDDSVIRVVYTVRTYKDADMTEEVEDSAKKFDQTIQLNTMVKSGTENKINKWVKNSVYSYDLTISPVTGEIFFDVARNKWADPIVIEKTLLSE